MTTLQQIQDETKIVSDLKLDSALWAFRTYGNTNGFKDQNKYAKEEVSKIKDYINTQITKAYQAGQREVVERVNETVRAEKITWAKESIGWKAVESVENALKDKLTNLYD